MKISVDSVTKSPRKYPYLGISENGRLVLFTEKETGLCLRSVPSCSKELTYSSSWMEHQFSLYEGTVTLTNN